MMFKLNCLAGCSLAMVMFVNRFKGEREDQGHDGGISAEPDEGTHSGDHDTRIQ